MNTLIRRAAVALTILVAALAGAPTPLAAAPGLANQATHNVAAVQPIEAGTAALEQQPALVTLGELLPGVRTATAARNAEDLTNAIMAAEAHAEAEAAAAAAAAAEAQAAAAEAQAAAAEAEAVAAEAEAVAAVTEAEAEAAAVAQTAAPGWPWSQLVQCEASGNWQIANGNGYYGGLQFAHSTWVSYGGQAYAGYAHQATPAQQVEIAERIVASHGGSYGAWPGCRAKLGLP